MAQRADWQDLNPGGPRFGLPEHAVLAETPDSFAAQYTMGALLVPFHAQAPARLYTCTRLVEGGAFAVKVFVRPVWPAPGGTAFMMDAERKCVAREVDILRHVDCPEYIITLTACFITGGVVSLVMPLLQSNLYHLYAVRFTEGFSDEEVRTVAVRMLRALKYLHATLHVVHRDVKPENIFLRIGGDVRTCVLADVGHSRSLDTGQLASTVNGCLGTPRFAPPEFAQTKPHTHAVDVYQLGASLVVLLICAGPGRVADQLTLFGDQMHFDVPEWAALVRAGGASGKARKACVERMMSIAPAMRGSASVNLQDPWVSGAVPAVDA